jgi:hypothetical protein
MTPDNQRARVDDGIRRCLRLCLFGPAPLGMIVEPEDRSVRTDMFIATSKSKFPSSIGVACFPAVRAFHVAPRELGKKINMVGSVFYK